MNLNSLITYVNQLIDITDFTCAFSPLTVCLTHTLKYLECDATISGYMADALIGGMFLDLRYVKNIRSKKDLYGCFIALFSVFSLDELFALLSSKLKNMFQSFFKGLRR